MKLSKRSPNNPTGIVILFFIVVLGLGISMPAVRKVASTSIVNKMPRVQNKTRAFDVVSTSNLLQAGAQDKGVYISLRNNYDKRITAFALSVNGLINTVDFVYSEGEDKNGILPGSIYKHEASFAQSSDPKVAAQQSIEISVLAVVFDDKTSDGDLRPITGILNTRRQSKAQLADIISLLDKNLKSAAASDDHDLNGLKSQLVTTRRNSQSPDDAGDAIRWLDHHKDLSPQQRVRELKQTLEGLLERL